MLFVLMPYAAWLGRIRPNQLSIPQPCEGIVGPVWHVIVCVVLLFVLMPYAAWLGRIRRPNQLSIPQPCEGIVGPVWHVL